MSGPAPDWYPDPSNRHQHRYWDGTSWTEHVADDGVQSVDPPGGPAPAQAATAQAAASPQPGAQGGAGGVMDMLDNVGTFGDAGRADQIQKQLHGDGKHSSAKVGAAAFQGGGGVLTEPILVVNQRAKLIELKQEYSVFDQHGTKIASVNQVGQGTARKALRLLTSLDQFLGTKLEITDAAGNVVLALHRPGKVFKSTIIVSRGDGAEIGRIVQENMIGKIRFGLVAGDQQVGMIKAENWRAWNFSIEDAQGQEVARITKTWEGMAKTMFTTADNYVVQLHRQLPDPLRSLVVASALSVDTALKQDDRGLA